jgi:hypothetical protein
MGLRKSEEVLPDSLSIGDERNVDQGGVASEIANQQSNG